MKNLTQLFVIFLLAVAVPLHANAGVTVIGNSANGMQSLTPVEADQLFLKKLKKAGKFSAQIVDLPEGSAVRAALYQKISNKSKVQMKSYWARFMFTGAGNLPDELPDDGAVIEFVKSNQGAIGYIGSSSGKPAGVTVLLTLDDN